MRSAGIFHATRLLGCCLLVAFGSGMAIAGEAWRPLWNGRDLTGWTSWLGTPEPTSTVPGLVKGPNGKYPAPLGSNHDPLQVFSVVTVDGQPAIRVSGEVLGELRCAAMPANYRLRLQFKWGRRQWPPKDRPGAPRDSGLLYHVHAAPGTGGRPWSRAIEFQIQEHDVGDLYAVGSAIFVRSTLHRGTGDATASAYEYDAQGNWNVFSQVPGMVGRCLKHPDAEKPAGEWNTLELICLGEDSIHVVNGTVVMRLHGPTRLDLPTPQPVTSGPIVLQSEYAEIYYRALEYQPITAIPEEYTQP